MKNKIKIPDKKGFSLVELIVVIAIMAVLVAVLAPALLQYVERSRAQKDDSAMGEVTNAIQLALADQNAYDEALKYVLSGKDGNWAYSCYVDKETPNENNKVVTKDKGKTTEQYLYSDAERKADEVTYTLNGRMRGLTITFSPSNIGSSKKKEFVLANGSINSSDSTVLSEINTESDDTTMKGQIYNKLRAAIGDTVPVTSQTYRNSSYTVFIRMGTTGANASEAQDAIKVYGQWGGTNLAETASSTGGSGSTGNNDNTDDQSGDNGQDVSGQMVTTTDSITFVVDGWGNYSYWNPVDDPEEVIPLASGLEYQIQIGDDVWTSTAVAMDNEILIGDYENNADVENFYINDYPDWVSGDGDICPVIFSYYNDGWSSFNNLYSSEATRGDIGNEITITLTEKCPGGVKIEYFDIEGNQTPSLSSAHYNKGLSQINNSDKIAIVASYGGAPEVQEIQLNNVSTDDYEVNKSGSSVIVSIDNECLDELNDGTQNIKIVTSKGTANAKLDVNADVQNTLCFKIENGTVYFRRDKAPGYNEWLISHFSQKYSNTPGSFKDAYDGMRAATKIVIENEIKPDDCSGLFSSFLKCQEIEGLENLDTSAARNMYRMFYEFGDSSNMPSLDLRGLNVANCESMGNMFYGARIKSLNLSNWNTGNVTVMTSMFGNCSNWAHQLETLNVSGWNTSNVTDMSGMFSGQFETLNLSSFDTSNVTNMRSMFAGCYNLKSIDVSGFDTSHVTDFGGMFSSNYALESLDLRNFVTSQSEDMSEMFRGCSGISEIKVGSGWQIEQANTTGMFYYCAVDHVTQV